MKPIDQEKSSALPPVRYVTTNGIRMAVYEAGTGPAVLLLHGFPELAYSFRHLIPPLVEAGYHVIAPDQRGYGLTDRPPAVEAYDMANLTADLVGLLDVLGIDKAIVAGHDWGSNIAWQMPLLHPSRVAGVISLNIPYIPDGGLWLHPSLTGAVLKPGASFVFDPAVDPIAQMRTVYDPGMYVLSFHDSDYKDKLMALDVRRTYRSMMRKGMFTAATYAALPPEAKHMKIFQGLEGPEPAEYPGTLMLTDEDLNFYVRSFERTGFTPAINWYRNWSRNWKATRDIDQTVRIPSLMIAAEDDVMGPAMMDGMENCVTDLEKHVILNCGHFSMEEKPDKVSAIILEWLRRRFPA